MIFVKTDVGFELTCRIVSLNEIINDRNSKPIRALDLFILENKFSPTYSKYYELVIFFFFFLIL